MKNTTRRAVMGPLAAVVLTASLVLTIKPGAAAQGAIDQAPAYGQAHFHHMHLNTTDPAAAISFYTSKFDCEKARFAGLLDGVWAQKSWFLFNKVSAPAPWEFTSAIWHFGWGAEDMKAVYQKQLDSGTKFFTPLSDISDLAGVPNFFYAYVDGPDHALIELNTAPHHHFGHLHLFSEDPVSAGLWYMKYFGAVRRGGANPPSREVRNYRGFQVGPSMSLMLDNVNIIIFPIQLSKQSYPDQWKNQPAGIVPTKGRTVDHVGFSVEDLPAALESLRKDGVKVTDEMKSVAGGKIKYAFIEGPDHIRIELVEGQAKKE